MEPNVKPNGIMDYAGSIFLVVLFLVGFYIYSKIASNNPPSSGTVPVAVERPVVTCPADRLSYTTVTKNVKLIEIRTSMFAENGKFINPQVVIAKSETQDSKVACGYVFMRAGTAQGALRSWENIFVVPNAFGGHINPDSTISRNDGANFSEYLFSLDKIQYWPDRNRKTVLEADWAALLNVSPEINFNIALNTTDKTGFIDEITIAYKCWNPATGEENTGCKLVRKSIIETQSNNPVN
ncbi:MAG: hypothetical protein AAB797_03235 [Patescibacteria group bacterium]